MMEYISKKHNATSFSICPENFTGEKGKGGMAIEGTGLKYADGLGQGWKISPSIVIPSGETFVLADVQKQGAIKHIWFTPIRIQERFLILRIYWDGSDTPSIECPLGDFFASAKCYEDFKPISSLAVCVNPARALNCYWEMPFKKGFKMTLENRSDKDTTIYYQIDCEEKEIDDDSLYFHAQFRRVNPLPYKTDYTIIDNVKGNGQYVGTYMCWGVHNNGWWGEGEIKFFIDGDTKFPTICGTGTEDYFCGAYDFEINNKYLEFTTPYSGLSKVDATDGCYKSQMRFNMYRWHITDPIYFKSDLRVTIQAIGWRNELKYLPLQDDISSVAYWYSDRNDDVYPELPDRDYCEII